MIKTLTLYKDVKPAYKLIRWERQTNNHRRLYFENGTALKPDSLIWAEKDLQANDRKLIMIIDYVYEDGSARVRFPDDRFMNKVRDFQPDELFMVIALWEENKEIN